MVREVPMLVSDSPCSSVLLSDDVLLLSAGAGAGAAGAAPAGAAGTGMCILGVTWNRPTVIGADWTSGSVVEAFGLGVLVFISGTVECNGALKVDKVLSGLSGEDGEKSDMEVELETSDLGSAWTGTCAGYEST